MLTRTTIQLDESILKEAYSLMPDSNKRTVIELALKEFIQKRKRKDLRDLFDANLIDENYDYKAMRTGSVKLWYLLILLQ